MVKKYIPERGNVVWVNFNPQRGREQRGKRPAAVLSPKSYNSKAGLAIVCPITSQVKGYPFEVVFDIGKARGAILVDQIRTLDWEKRLFSFAGRLDAVTLSEVQEKVIRIINED